MIRLLHRTALAGMGAGIALVLQPLWPPGFKLGFFLTLGATVVYIVSIHLVEREGS